MITLLSVAVLVTNTGCEKFLTSNSSQKSNSTIKYQDSSFMCIKSWPDKINRYFTDEVHESEIEEIFNCLDSSITQFSLFAMGEESDRFKISELLYYFNRYLLKDNQINEGLIKEVLKIKVLLMGGDPNYIKRDELPKVKQTLQLIKKEALFLKGYWRILLLKEQKDVISEKSLEGAKAKIDKVLQEILEQTNLSSSNYSWDDFKTLIGELELFLKNETVFSSLKKYFPAVEAAQQLFIGKYNAPKNKDQWLNTIEWVSSSFEWLARINYFLIGRDLSTNTNLIQMINTIDLGFKLVESAPVFKIYGQDKIEFNKIDSLMDTLGNLGLLNSLNEASAENVKKFYKLIILKIINTNYKKNNPDLIDETVNAISLELISVIKQEFLVWKNAITLSNEILSKTGLKKFEFINELKSKSKELKGYQLEAFSDWISILSQSKNLSFTEEKKLVYPRVSGNYLIELDNLFMLSNIRSLVRLILLGYGQGDERLWNRVLTLEAWKKFDTDFSELSAILKLKDPRQLKTSAERTYKEAIYFMPNSDGISTLNSQVLMEEFSTLFSGGMSVTNQMIKDLERNNCLLNKFDILGGKLVDSRCFEIALREKFNNYFSNLPKLTKEFSNGKLNLNNALNDLYNIAKFDATKTETIELGEIKTMSVVLHYIEALFDKFDEDRDDLLSLQELEKAFPRFKTIFSAIDLHGFEPKLVYLYIIYEKALPDTNRGISTWVNLKKFDYFKYRLGLLDRVNRADIIKALSNLKTFSKNK